MSNTETKTATGTCQICAKTCKLDAAGLTSIHGYKRPGCGWINGRCMGSRVLPYEQDRSVLAAYLVMLAERGEYLAQAVETVTNATELHVTNLQTMTVTTHVKGVITTNSWGCQVEEFKHVQANKLQDLKSERFRLAREVTAQTARYAA